MLDGVHTGFFAYAGGPPAPLKGRSVCSEECWHRWRHELVRRAFTFFDLECDYTQDHIERAIDAVP
jgi:hypothetical protein